MAHYQLILAYDGTRFAGFQRQARERTVQGVLEASLRQIGWTGLAIQGAGRTDTGVHAEGQVTAFDLGWKHSIKELLQAINVNLPDDVSAREIHLVPETFHPRYSAVARTYRYRIFRSEIRDPLRERYAWRVWPETDLSLLDAAAEKIVGTHDFAAFGSPPRKGASTVRTVMSAAWKADGREASFTVRGNAFLYHMVRRLVYLQVQVGQGRIPLENLNDSLVRQSSQKPGLAPPNGLTLIQVEYPPFDSERDKIILAEGSNTLAACGEDDRGQDLRP